MVLLVYISLYEIIGRCWADYAWGLGWVRFMLDGWLVGWLLAYLGW